MTTMPGAAMELCYPLQAAGAPLRRGDATSLGLGFLRSYDEVMGGARVRGGSLTGIRVSVMYKRKYKVYMCEEAVS